MRSQDITYRFKFLLIVTVVVAASTMATYIFGQVSKYAIPLERDWLHEETYHITWTSAIDMMVYAMCNCYVIMLLVFYAPSQDLYTLLQRIIDKLPREREVASEIMYVDKEKKRNSMKQQLTVGFCERLKLMQNE